MDPIVYDDLEPRTQQFVIGKITYWMVEADGDAKAKWQNAVTACSKFRKDGSFDGVQGAGDLEPYLVSLCLFKADNEGKVPRLANGDLDKTRRPALSTVRSWLGRIQDDLFRRAKAMSGIDVAIPLDKLVERVLEDVASLVAANYADREGLLQKVTEALAVASDPKE